MPSIAICGAGPAGLTLARLLQVTNNPSLQVTIFEKDASPTSRYFQGGTLDLHPETALAAVRAAGLWDEVQEFARYEGEELIFADKNAAEIMHMVEGVKVGHFDARPEIDREKLKEILLKSVKPEIIRWGKNLRSINETSGVLTFGDGSEAGPFDLVVGGDGAWSKVRNVLSNDKPKFSGICGFEGKIDPESAGKDWEAVSKLVRAGSYFSFSDGKSLMGQRMGDGTLKISMWVQKEETWPADVIERAGGDDAKIRKVLLDQYTGWDAGMRQLVELAYRFRPWPLYELPIGHRWDHKKGWTLIGDSAHLMTPFAGEGVNAAMRDSLDLSEAITKALASHASLDEAVKNYEELLFPRSQKVQEDTAYNKEGMFREDAPVAYLTGMIGKIAGEAGYDINKGWLAWAPITKLVHTYFSSMARFGLVKRYIRDYWYSRGKNSA